MRSKRQKTLLRSMSFKEQWNAALKDLIIRSIAIGNKFRQDQIVF
jgi:hypothetical protein